MSVILASLAQFHDTLAGADVGHSVCIHVLTLFSIILELLPIGLCLLHVLVHLWIPDDLAGRSLQKKKTSD